MSVLKVATIQDLSSANSSTPEQVAQGRAKAWVRFNTVTSTTITDSYNVTSLTDNGTGDTTINFTVAMPSANYAVCGSGSGLTTNGVCLVVSTATAPTTSAVRVITDRQSTGVVDVIYASVIIFGD